MSLDSLQASGTARGHEVADPPNGPVIVLTFGFAGVQSLEDILVGRPELACTSGTGVIPVCAHAVAAWRQLEQSAAGMSALAAASVRALATTMITTILSASAGASRWCEIATAPASADPFARLFPQARFVCYHRACVPVIWEVTGASRWGLGSAGIGDFAAMYRGNSVAAVAAYWCAQTSALLDFEAAHSNRSLRVRHEDLTAGSAAAARSILRFLGLPDAPPGRLGLPAPSRDMAIVASPSGTGADAGARQQIPVELIPAQMLERINGLHARLGYPAL